jgi:hypothetical protein
MQGSYSSSDRTESGIFGRVLASSHSLFTPKRVGFTLAGAFVPTEDDNGKSSVSVTASNDSSNSTLNVNISSSNSGTSNSSSHSSSHTVITQNGSTTITNSH